MAPVLGVAGLLGQWVAPSHKKIGGGAPNHLRQHGDHAEVRIRRAALDLNERGQCYSRARGDLAPGQTRAEPGGPKILSEQDFDAMRQFVVRHEMPPRV
jgi:hypothetical protein